MVWNKIGMIVHPKRRRYGYIGHLPNQMVDCWVGEKVEKGSIFMIEIGYTESANQVIRVPILLV